MIKRNDIVRHASRPNAGQGWVALELDGEYLVHFFGWKMWCAASDLVKVEVATSEDGWDAPSSITHNGRE